MDRITQSAYFRQRVIRRAEKRGVEEAANHYRCSRKTVYKWMKRYDGTVESLKDRSRKPHSSPRGQTSAELKLVRRYARKYPGDLLLGYEKAKQYGYQRSYGCFKRTVEKYRAEPGKGKKRRKNQPYHRAAFPGEKVQMDVKFVPTYCIADGKKYYEYVAKDECSRWTFRYLYAEHSTYSSYDFLLRLLDAAPFMICKIQTDNGSEFTNTQAAKGSETMFERGLKVAGIAYQRIRVATPRHNGKVERQHRIDEMRFFKHMRMYGLEDGQKQLAVYQRESNNHIMTCLHMKSPNQVLAMYQGVM